MINKGSPRFLFRKKKTAIVRFTIPLKKSTYNISMCNPFQNGYLYPISNLFKEANTNLFFYIKWKGDI